MHFDSIQTQSPFDSRTARQGLEEHSLAPEWCYPSAWMFPVSNHAVLMLSAGPQGTAVPMYASMVQCVCACNIGLPKCGPQSWVLFPGRNLVGLLLPTSKASLLPGASGASLARAFGSSLLKVHGPLGDSFSVWVSSSVWSTCYGHLLAWGSNWVLVSCKWMANA